MFSQACVKNSVHGGNMRGKGGGACIVKRGMCGEGGMHGKGGVHGEGACVVTGGVCGKVEVCMVKACMIGGMHGKRGVTCMAGGHAWPGGSCIQERQPLKRMVRIPCFYVFSVATLLATNTHFFNGRVLQTMWMVFIRH